MPASKNTGLPSSIEDKVHTHFLKRDQSQALALLAGFECKNGALRERVLNCIVSLAGRDIDRLKHFVDCARENYRNLIMWHEHAAQSRDQFFSK